MFVIFSLSLLSIFHLQFVLKPFHSSLIFGQRSFQLLLCFFYLFLFRLFNLNSFYKCSFFLCYRTIFVHNEVALFLNLNHSEFVFNWFFPFWTHSEILRYFVSNLILCWSMWKIWPGYFGLNISLKTGFFVDDLHLIKPFWKMDKRHICWFWAFTTHTHTHTHKCVCVNSRIFWEKFFQIRKAKPLK